MVAVAAALAAMVQQDESQHPTAVPHQEENHHHQHQQEEMDKHHHHQQEYKHQQQQEEDNHQQQQQEEDNHQKQEERRPQLHEDKQQGETHYVQQDDHDEHHEDGHEHHLVAHHFTVKRFHVTQYDEDAFDEATAHHDVPHDDDGHAGDAHRNGSIAVERDDKQKTNGRLEGGDQHVAQHDDAASWRRPSEAGSSEHDVHDVISTHSSSVSRRTSRRDSVYPINLVVPQKDTPSCGILGRCMQPIKRRVKSALDHPLCPNHSWMLRMISMIIIGILFYGAAVFLIGGRGWFNMVVAVFVAQVVGHVVHKATSLPPLLGMLLVGVCVRYVGFIDQFSEGHDSVVYVVRSIALVSLLVRTGFRLDPAGVRRVPGMVLAVAVIPGIAEALSVAVMGHYLLGMAWEWTGLLGIILAAVCPSVLMPCFQHMGAGRSVNVVLVAAACINNLIAIFGFGINMAVIFSHANSLSYNLLHRFMGMACGLLLGVTVGFIVKYIPEQNDPHVATLRSLLLGSLGVFAVIGFTNIGFFGAGPFLVIMATFVSCWGWRSQGWGTHYNPVATVYEVLWRIMEPVMFCLIGAEVRVAAGSAEVLFIGIGVLFAAWAIRIVVSLALMSSGDLNVRERLFITLAWMPKAGVQAALCPLAMELTRRWGYDVKGELEVEESAKDVMLLVLMAVVLTAPLSAALNASKGLSSALLKSEDSRRPSAAA